MGFSNMDYLMEELGDVLTNLIVLERQVSLSTLEGWQNLMYLELPLLEQLLDLSSSWIHFYSTRSTTVPLRNRCTLSSNAMRAKKQNITQQRGKNSREMKYDAGDNKIVGKFCMES